VKEKKRHTMMKMMMMMMAVAFSAVDHLPCGQGYG
jgi:hypothetical protein